MLLCVCAPGRPPASVRQAASINPSPPVRARVLSTLDLRSGGGDRKRENAHLTLTRHPFKSHTRSMFTIKTTRVTQYPTWHLRLIDRTQKVRDYDFYMRTIHIKLEGAAYTRSAQNPSIRYFKYKKTGNTSSILARMVLQLKASSLQFSPNKREKCQQQSNRRSPIR